MKNNKKMFIVISIIIILLVGYFIFIHRGITGKNKKTLTVAEEITLNDNEKELLSELVNVNDKLLNPTVTENVDINSSNYTEVVKPKEPIKLKDFCLKLYEARKTTNEQGETLYLFDMDTKGNNGEIIRRFILTKNGEITGCSFVESDYAESLEQMENTTVENGNINLGREFVKALFEGFTKAIEETWNKATVYDNVNYNSIFSKI